MKTGGTTGSTRKGQHTYRKDVVKSTKKFIQTPSISEVSVNEDNVTPTPIIVNEQMEKVFDSAAKLQQLVPNAVLVGGSAVSIHIGHRYSTDHDHVLTDLNERFGIVFDSLNNDTGWSTFRVTEDKIILGKLDGVEAGIRQLRRAKQLEIQEFTLPSGKMLTVPTLDEITRIKGYFIVNRNQMRDYVDIAGLALKTGGMDTAKRLVDIDNYYSDVNKYENSIASELVLKLANPEPKDSRSIENLSSYKGIASELSDWNNVKAILHTVAKEMIIIGDEKDA